MAKKQTKVEELPDYLTVGGLEFKVKRAHLDNEVWGDCNISELEIRISLDCPEDKLWATLFHETVHACLAIGGLNETLEDRVEESIVRNLEHFLWPLVEFK